MNWDDLKEKFAHIWNPLIYYREISHMNQFSKDIFVLYCASFDFSRLCGLHEGFHILSIQYYQYLIHSVKGKTDVTYVNQKVNMH